MGGRGVAAPFAGSGNPSGSEADAGHGGGPGGAAPHPAQTAVARIDRWLDGEYPDIESSWSGVLEIESTEEMPGAAGAKASNCNIVVRSDVAASAPWRFSTLLHEALHARSLGDRDYQVYRGMRGWEEGVVEQLTRLNRRSMLEDLGEDGSIDDEAREVRDRPHPYNGYIHFMESARRMLGQDKRGFYEELLRVPLTERSSYLYDKGVTQFGGQGDRLGRWRDEFTVVDYFLRNG